MRLLLRKSGNFLELSPVPELVRRELEPQFTYWRLIAQFGKAAYNNFSGERQPVRSELRRLYGYDAQGRMLIPIGFEPRVRAALRRLGYEIEYVNVDPPRPRPDCYEPDWENVLRYMTLRHGQAEFLAALSAADRGLFSAPPGYGKSALISAVGLLYPKAVIHVTTTRVAVVKRLFQELHQLLPSVGQVGGGRRIENRRIMIYSAASLHHADADEADILIGDEAHELSCPTFAEQLVRYPYARRYGLSATTEGRFDGGDLELESFFGPVIYTMPYQEAERNDLVVPIVILWRDVVMDYNPCNGMNDVPKKRWGLWRNEYRNGRIVEAAREFDTDSQVLIMVETIEHAVYLRKLLPDYTLVYAQLDPNDRADYIRNGFWERDEPALNDRTRDELRVSFESGELRKVIATGCWSTGVSFNNLEVLIRADASASAIMATQIPGRVCRTAPDKTVGYVVDFFDCFDRGFREKAKKRKRAYAAHGWEQQDDHNGHECRDRIGIRSRLAASKIP